MLGVLLRRPAADDEVVNDLDGRVVNWWAVVRERPDDLGEMLEWTPDRSRDVLRLAVDRLDDPDPVRRAWAFTVAACMSASPDLSGRLKVSFAGGSRERLGVRHRLRPLADRMRLVQLENCDAVDLVGRCPAPSPGMGGGSLVYADPPYPGRAGGGYGADVDHGALDEALLAAAARGIDVACSGYRGDRPALEDAGWDRHEFRTVSRAAVTMADERPERVECLWVSWREEGRLEFGP